LDYSFPRYLLAKQTVDDRALNHLVLARLEAELAAYPFDESTFLSSIDAGAGIGTMLARLLRSRIVSHVNYVAVDGVPENIGYAREWIPRWAEGSGLHADRSGGNSLRIWGDALEANIALEREDIFDFVPRNRHRFDLLITHAFLDLLPMPVSLPRLLSLLRPGGLAWLTLNFDGVTTLEPAIDPVLDALIERLYHGTMDARPTGGDSHSGRHLFGHLQQVGAELLAAGASDWVVHPRAGRYLADEAYFLHFILHFFEQSLTGHPELDAEMFAAWLATRHGQVERGELVYIAHQMDFLARVGTAK